MNPYPPPPHPTQVRILWGTLTALAVAVLVGLLAGAIWGIGEILRVLSPVLWPLALAGVLAYLLDPLVDLIERRGLPRARAIALVFATALVLVGGVFADPTPTVGDSRPPDPQAVVSLKAASAWLVNLLPAGGSWLLEQLGKVSGGFGMLAGLFLVPVYAFYFLLEKRGIEREWTDYLPVRNSQFKDELVFILRSINDYLIVFFRSQLLVAICDGALYTLGFLLIGLPYAFIIGLMATVLTMIPFLGAITTCVAALVVGFASSGDWVLPAQVLVVFAVVQTLEGLVISPKIMGDRVGLHPLTIIIAVMVGTTLLGGLLGGILAIPLTAALRVLMFRYVWRRSGHPANGSEPSAAAH
jgi:predicted PurR-regulated permease PerM